MASPLRKQQAGVAMGSVELWRGRRAGLQLPGRGEECGFLDLRGEGCGFLDLLDRPLLTAGLGPARAAAGAEGERIETERDGDAGRSAPGSVAGEPSW